MILKTRFLFYSMCCLASTFFHLPLLSQAGGRVTYIEGRVLSIVIDRQVPFPHIGHMND